MSNSLDVSIVVYGHDESSIGDVINSLCASVKKSSVTKLSIIIIDNKGGFNLSILKELIDHDYSNCIELIVRKDNPGYGVANNSAIQRGDASYHLILNPDVIFSIDAIDNAMIFFDSHPECILLSPKILDNDNNVISGIKRYPSIFALVLRYLDISILNEFFHDYLSNYACIDLINLDQFSKITIASGCCMLFKKEALKNISGLSEEYFLYFEDFDLSIKSKSYGEIYYLPSFEIKHFGGNTGRKGFKHVKYFITSMIRFFCKHGIKVY
jgi:GT2 family glycosyltransferase